MHFIHFLDGSHILGNRFRIDNIGTMLTLSVYSTCGRMDFAENTDFEFASVCKANRPRVRKGSSFSARVSTVANADFCVICLLLSKIETGGRIKNESRKGASSIKEGSVFSHEPRSLSHDSRIEILVQWRELRMFHRRNHSYCSRLE